MTHSITWPEGKRFAFTAFDDADKDRFYNTVPVYEFLKDLGFRTTKSVWLLPGEIDHSLGGDSCHNSEYLEWVKELMSNGFEIGWHNARYHSSPRPLTEKALDLFAEHFGHPPRCMSNHFENREAIYWGSARLSGPFRAIYNIAQFGRGNLSYEGHKEDSKFFWGDLCRDRIEYVRNFVFNDIDTLGACPEMPYHDPQMPYVRSWYASSEAGNLQSFNELMKEENQDRLIESGGACILYTHFGKDFWSDGQLNPRFVTLMERLANAGGWFVPVSVLLDYIRDSHGGVSDLTLSRKFKLQSRWLARKLLKGSS